MNKTIYLENGTPMLVELWDGSDRELGEAEKRRQTCCLPTFSS